MTDRPIVFSSGMVRALLAGTKTQTRRYAYGPWIAAPDMDSETQEHFDVLGHIFDIADGTVRAHATPAPWARTKVGDRLWVRETWRSAKAHDAYSGKEMAQRCSAAGYRSPWAPIEYVADGARGNWEPHVGDIGRYRHAPFMPRWASRLTLVVTDVRVERLQEISEDDAVAEGVENDTDGWRDYLFPGTQCCASARDSFRTIWDSLHGTGSWDANPWVVAITFTVHLINIDHMEKAA